LQGSTEEIPLTRPRATLVSLEDTSWYHCVSYCVRRAFLCGKDHFAGKNFEHRRGWIAERIKRLSAIFAIDVAACAVMSNHYHVVVRIDRERVLGWSVDEVLTRWTALFSGPLLVAQYLSRERAEMTSAQIACVQALAENYRAHLYDLSWFMRTLNEYIARRPMPRTGSRGDFGKGASRAKRCSMKRLCSPRWPTWI
jgi:hypothetical protein